MIFLNNLNKKSLNEIFKIYKDENFKGIGYDDIYFLFIYENKRLIKNFILYFCFYYFIKNNFFYAFINIGN